MNTVESRLASEDATYRADYFRALAELNGKPQLLLPSPAASDAQWMRDKMPLHPFAVPAVHHEPDPDSRADVLSRIRVVKTVQHGIRDVLLDGAKIGRIAAFPWGPGWFASSTRSRVFWSMEDAALALVDDAVEASR